MHTTPKFPKMLRSQVKLLACGIAAAAGLSACGGTDTELTLPPAVSLSATPASLAVGATLTLSWNSSNAQSCVAGGDWTGARATSGSENLVASADGVLSFTLSCGGPGGTDNAEASVTVGNGITGLWSTGYYPAYATARMPITQIPFAAMTHVIHFALIPTHASGTGTVGSTAGEVGTLSDPFELLDQADALVAAARSKGSKVLLGIGGDTSVDAPLGFQQALASSAGRTRLIDSITDVIADKGYDGVDVNWESLRFPDDVAALRSFIGDLRDALDTLSPAKRLLLTYPAGTASDFDNYANTAALLAPVAADIDQINLQTYVMGGPYQGWVTWHNSPLRAGDCVFSTTGTPPPTVASTVQAFTAAGISRSRLGIGIQLAGVDWKGGSGTTTGGVSRPCQSWDYSATRPNGQDIGAPDYANWQFVDVADVIRNYTPGNGYIEQFDEDAQMPWLSRDRAGSADDHFVSFENASSIAAKADYLREEGLGGTIIFEITQDYLPERATTDAQHPLMTAIRQNILERP